MKKIEFDDCCVSVAAVDALGQAIIAALDANLPDWRHYDQGHSVSSSEDLPDDGGVHLEWSARY